MKRSVLRKALLSELDKRFLVYGFSRFSDRFLGDRFDRRVPEGRQSVYLMLYNRGDAIERDAPYIAIRLDAVEDMISKFEEPGPIALREADVNARSTIGFRPEPSKGIAGLLRRSWMIANEAQAVKAAAEFVPSVMADAQPFWERFTKPSDVFHLLTSGSAESRDLGGPDNLRAKKVVALALTLVGLKEAKSRAAEAIAMLRGDAAEEVARWTERALGKSVRP